MLAAVILPFTSKPVNVPSDVTFGCAAVVSVPVKFAAPIVPALAYTLPAVAFPVTARLDNVPTLVIFGCAFVYTVPETSAFAT